MKKLKKAASLAELSFSDQPTIPSCFLYKLSQGREIGSFTNVILVSSQQDQYSPYASSRMEVHPSALQDNQEGQHFVQMAKNLLGNIKAKQLVKIDVRFNILEK